RLVVQEKPAEFFRFGTPASKGRSRALQCASNDGSLSALFGGQVRIARTQREPVALPNGLHTNHAHGQIEIAHHAPQHGELLVILEAKDSSIGLGDGEELQYNCTDAAEMSRTRCAAQGSAHEFFIDPCRVIRCVHRFCGWMKDGIRSLRCADRLVCRERSGIPCEIFLRSKLSRIYENADDYRSSRACNLPGAFDQRGVSGVESPHRWHQDNGMTSIPAVTGGCRNGTQNFQGRRETTVGDCGDSSPVRRPAFGRQLSFALPHHVIEGLLPAEAGTTYNLAELIPTAKLKMSFQMPILSALDFQGSIADCIIWYFVFVYTTVLHEAGNAWAAYRLGDA